MKKQLLIATTNPEKLADFRRFMANVPIELVSLKDVGITDKVEEDGKTYEENSQKKALFYASKAGLPALGDDSGLEIAALNGAPGVRSRRWLGYEATDEELFTHLRAVTKDIPDDYRKAFFKTVISLATPDGKVGSVEGSIEGIIAREPHPNLIKGYPYRSFFYLPQIGKYYHKEVLTEKEDFTYNHRYKALIQLKPTIIKLYT